MRARFHLNGNRSSAITTVTDRSRLQLQTLCFHGVVVVCKGATSMPNEEEEALVEDRRRFLKTCGRFAIVTPPTITLLLASGQQNFAVAGSGMSGGGSFSSGTTYFVPRDDGLIQENGGVKPGDTICWATAASRSASHRTGKASCAGRGMASLSLPSGLSVHLLGDEGLLLDSPHQRLYALNASATFIWRGLSGGGRRRRSAGSSASTSPCRAISPPRMWPMSSANMRNCVAAARRTNARRSRLHGGWRCGRAAADAHRDLRAVGQCLSA